MRYVSIESLEPGNLLGKTIFSSNGAVLLNEGVQLTVFMINTLNRIGVTYIYVLDELFEDVEITDVLSEETKRVVMKQMNDMFQSVRSGKEFNTKQVSMSIDQLLSEVMSNRDVLIQLSDIRSAENEAYVHALNVCVVSSVIGLNMGLNALQLKELAIGALLHDLGKVSGWTPSDDENVDLKLHHTWRGFDRLKRDYSLLTAHVAMQHHEHADGTGLPRGIAGEDIHPYARIVAVANVFDNLLSHPDEEGKRLLPHEACEKMMAMAGRQLDKEVLIQFLKHVSVYPTGASVKLTNRESGVVVGQHRGLPSRPIVRVVKQEDGQLEIKEFDLAKLPTLFIEAVLP